MYKFGLGRKMRETAKEVLGERTPCDLRSTKRQRREEDDQDG